MKDLKLLIVDDVEDNRMVLHAICRKMDGFEIKEAVDGIEAIEMCDSWNPDIILMDVMMPRLDGLEASKIIKKRFPETIIMVITAVIDPQMEANMSSVGISAYLHKPIDKELLRYKLQSFRAYLASKDGEHSKLSTKTVLNPFCTDVRNYKTIFSISDAEGMMDFGVWMLSRCSEYNAFSCSKLDPMVELFYELMRQGVRDKEEVSIIIEENFEEIFITMKLSQTILLKEKNQELVNDLGDDCIIRENVACIRLNTSHTDSKFSFEKANKPIITPTETIINVPEITTSKLEIEKEKKTIDANEQGLLRQSFVNKTSALAYVSEIGGDVLDEIQDLESLDEEWRVRLHSLENGPTIENLKHFADGVLGVYVKAINNLFEFTALAYALSSLGTFMKEHAYDIIADHDKLKKLVMLTEHLGSDLTSWREHIFALQDAADIHYLDSSFFSSCMQIEQIIGNKEITTDDDNDMEFF